MQELGHVYMNTSDYVHSELWRLFPVINVDKVKDIPFDYPGAMGVPLTIFDKLNRDQFEVLDLLDQPKIGGRALYKRIAIRNLKPRLPEYIDLTEWLNRTNAPYKLVVERQSEEVEEGADSRCDRVRACTVPGQTAEVQERASGGRKRKEHTGDRINDIQLVLLGKGRSGYPEDTPGAEAGQSA